MDFKTISGKWSKETKGELTGLVDSSQTARAITGSEVDQDYEIHATVNITSGKAAVIVNFDYDLDWKEWYLELILDPTQGKVTLDSVIRNTDGSEYLRETLASRDMTIATEKDYNIKIKSSEIETDVFAVYGYVNGFLVVEAEDLATGFEKGMCGFECLGSENDYSEFNKVFLQKKSYYTTLEALLNEIRSINKDELVGKQGTEQDLYDKLTTYIIEGSGFIDGESERNPNFFQHGGLELTEYHDGVGPTAPSGLYEFSEEEEAYQERAATIFTKQRPILSITTIKVNKAAIGETDNWQTITAYRWLTHGEIVFSSSTIPLKGTKNVEIVYKAGYNETPFDIKMACTRLIVNLIHKQIADRTGTFTSFTRPTAINFAMPDVYTPDIKAVLARYKIAGFGEM